MRLTPEARGNIWKWGRRSVVGLGAIGLVTIFAPMAIEGISASDAKSKADFIATGGTNIEKVGETNVYTIRPNGSAVEAVSKVEVMNKALIQIAKSNPNCELSTPWQMPVSGNSPKQLEELYYISVHCPSRLAQ